MSKIPCRKCKKCGKYSDLASLICVCGEDISSLPGILIDDCDLSSNDIGEMDRDLKVYVQKCSACGAMNFTISEDEPVKMCHNCHKTRVATIVPIEYIIEDEQVEIADECIEEEIVKGSVVNNNSYYAENEVVSQDDDDDEDDDDSVQWKNILGGINSAIEGEFPQISTQRGENPRTESVTTNDDDDDDEDDDDDRGWGNILGGTPQPKPQSKSVSVSKDITITAVRYGRLSYTIKTSETPFLLGRDANLKDFLSQDIRVSNEHCYLCFENGVWIVKDNHSSNGTAVNSRDIGLNGQKELNNGDEIKLGHHQDSMAFKVTIGS